MEFAFSEAQRWSGRKETQIDDSVIYHNELGLKTKFPSMTGTKNAWCASFVNWCLRKAGYQISSPHPYRARSFLGDSNFTEIEHAVYGAIAVIGTHHACFAYGQNQVTKAIIMLGGNQSDQINFSEFPSKTRFFVPAVYGPYAKNEMKDPKFTMSTKSILNKEIGITKTKADSNGTR